MPGCCAPNCHNSAAKGYIMKIFPRNKERRAKWAANVGRRNWSPTETSCLCEVHFEPTMWGKTTPSGRRKLKNDAVPTIFDFFLTKQNEKNESNKGILSKNQTDTDKIYQLQPKSELEVIKKSTINSKTSSTDDITLIVTENNTDQSSEITETQDSPSTRYSQKSIKKDKQVTISSEKCKRMISKLLERNEALRKELKKSRDTIRKLKNENNKLYKIRLKRMFTNDQIRAIVTKSTRPQYWSNETIIKALRLRFACGKRGYKELIKQNIPLPNIRTLQNRLQGHNISKLQKINVARFENERDKEEI